MGVCILDRKSKERILVGYKLVLWVYIELGYFENYNNIVGLDIIKAWAWMKTLYIFKGKRIISQRRGWA